MHEQKPTVFFGNEGSLLSNYPIPGLTGPELSFHRAKFYGGNYIIAEGMTEPVARKIAQALGLRYQVVWKCAKK